jgi:hypothetical protein
MNDVPPFRTDQGVVSGRAIEYRHSVSFRCAGPSYIALCY